MVESKRAWLDYSTPFSLFALLIRVTCLCLMFSLSSFTNSIIQLEIGVVIQPWQITNSQS